ncbi:ABC transporter ATP-binding protein [Caenispirillum bisanense]|uniref:ABC transporter ATP-binding protein n=1 Tax=Caenispirillum bisanense TaxID=414052 RepID=UPI0031D20193
MTMLETSAPALPEGTARPDAVPEGGDPAIVLSGVSKIYRLYGNPREQLLDSLGLYRFLPRSRRRTFQEFHALKSVDLTVERGERIGIIGRNGAGKTTLLKLITGNFAPTAGRIQVNGTVQALMQMGLGFHPEFSGYENIKSALNYNGLTGDEFEQAMADVIDFVELGDFLHQPMKTYSLGMNARVQFAAATAIKPDIMIVDEVLGAGDAYFSGKSAHRMEKLTSSGCTLLLVSHSTAQILQFCSKAIWLDRGQVRMAGSALDIVKAYEEYIQELSYREQRKAHEAAAAASPAGPVPMSVTEQKDYETHAWQRDQMMKLLADGGPGPSMSGAERVSRWPAERGLKIARVEVLNEAGVVTGTVQSGRPLDIEIEFYAEFDGHFECRFVVLLMMLDGVALSRHLSEPHEFVLRQGERRSVRLHYNETQLASGEFIFSAAIYKQYDPDNSSTAIRYDLLSRSFRLKVTPRSKSEPGVFMHPAEWKVVRNEGGGDE